MSDPAIQTESLRKNFGAKTAVRDLTLTVERGEVFGFLGPNGAGKTTSVKMLLGLAAPTAGRGEVLGFPLGSPQSRRKVGFLPEHFRFHDWLTGIEFLRLHAELFGGSVPRPRIPELLERVGLTEHGGQKLRTYSKGMLQRIGLAQALLNTPDLIFLDEPTSGLDPVGRRLVRDLIRDLRGQGATVFLNSHLLSEVEITCDRVAFIKNGGILQISPLQTLTADELTVQIRAQRMSPETLAGLSKWSANMRLDGDLLHLTLAGEAQLPEVTRYLTAQGADVFAIQPQKISLEDLFLEIVGTDGGL
jgi:ABC-2 type transport system ATP-binding protein